MASLANQTISSSYDGLIKTATDNAVGVSGVQLLEDGSGNSLALSVGRANNGVTISGNLAVDTDTLYVDAANNRVGIGTSSPASFASQASQLVVGSGSSNQGMSIYSGTTGEGNIFFADGTTGNQLYRGVIRYDHDGDYMNFFTAAEEAMRIDSSGNVGIGASPTSAGTYRVLELSGTASNGGYLRLSTSGTEQAAIASNSSELSVIAAGAKSTTFYNNGSERMRIDSSGNVGINCSPTAQLDVSSGATNVAAAFRSTDSGAYIGFADNTTSLDAGYPTSTIGVIGDDLILSTNNDIKMRITSAGNVGIGTSNAGAKLHTAVNSGVCTIKIHADHESNPTAALELQRGTNDTWGADAFADWRLANYQANLLFEYGENGTTYERMRITSGGNVLVDTDVTPNASNSGFAVFKDSFGCQILNSRNTTSTSNHYFFYNPNGAVGSISTSGSATAYNTSSDYRLKENVVPMEGALDRVDALKPSRFNFIADPEKTVDGFLAHEVQDIIPEAVTGEKDAVDEEGNPVYQGIDQSKIVPLLVGAIQELSAKVATLESQLNA